MARGSSKDKEGNGYEPSGRHLCGYLVTASAGADEVLVV